MHLLEAPPRSEVVFHHPPAAALRADAPTRLILVDLARVLAIFFMIQGHSLDVLLAPAYREGALFDVWLFLRGLTAPLFFILSGVSFTMATIGKWEEYSRVSWKLFRRIGRFAFFVALGYAMHLPASSLSEFRRLDAAAWQGWSQVDVLQCIGLALIGLQIVVLLAGTPTRLAQWSAVVGGAIILLTPLSWAVDWMGVFPMGIASYFNAQTGSLFPLFPWAGYIFLGATLGYYLREWSVVPGKSMRLLAVLGGVLGAAGVLLIKPFALLYADLDFWKTSPSLFLIRAACVCFLLALFAYVTARYRVPERACRAVAQESLLIYFVHVCFLYGSIWNPGMRQVMGATLTPLPTLCGIGLLTLTMMLMAWSWNWLKRAEPRRSYVLRFAIVLLAIYRPWT